MDSNNGKAQANQNLLPRLKLFLSALQGYQFYVGLERIKTTKLGFKWSDGSDLESNFDESMWVPNHPLINPLAEKCAVLLANQSLLTNTNCTIRAHFICETPQRKFWVCLLTIFTNR